MQWSKPTYEEIALSGEVTAYANTDATHQPASETAGINRPHGEHQNPE
ncbi:MAG: pyrroloquinoline quinone precursor peptide PqqA [Planctomycetota bacterium]|nr:pyrroloquinoline quinone precursor peptide PqqA [Planctomycetota bacterium]